MRSLGLSELWKTLGAGPFVELSPQLTAFFTCEPILAFSTVVNSFRAKLGRFSGSQLLQREGDRPQGAFVEVRLVAEAQRSVPCVEFLRALEEADDLAVLGIRGHPVPGFRGEGWRAGFDDRMDPLGH